MFGDTARRRWQSRSGRHLALRCIGGNTPAAFTKALSASRAEVMYTIGFVILYDIELKWEILSTSAPFLHIVNFPPFCVNYECLYYFWNKTANVMR